MFYVFALLLPFVFELSFYLAVLWVLIYFSIRSFKNKEAILIFILLLRCFMVLDNQNILIGNQYLVCREVFYYRAYSLVFLCDSKNTYISYFDPNVNIQYADEIYLYEPKFEYNLERIAYYKSLNVSGLIKFTQFKVLFSQKTFLGSIYAFKNRFKTFVQNNLNDPFANLFLGILIGDRSGYSKFLSEDLRFVGLTHLVAVSGMNVLLILNILKKFSWIFGRKLAFFFNSLFIIFFAYFTSLTTSVLRACFMSIINLWGEYNFLRLDSLKVLLFTAYALLLINPYYIVYDLSYALSFLATLALILVKDTERIVNDWKLEIQANLVSFWFTIPVILFAFKSLPVLTVFSNLLVMYPATLILYLGLFLILIYILNFDYLYTFIFFLLDLLGSYFFWVVDFTKKFPLMNLFIDSFKIRLVLFLFLLIIFFVFLRKNFKF